MIVRIITEGQYNLKGSYLDRLNELDNQIVSVVAAGDGEAFRRLFKQMLAIVRKRGRSLPPDELVESDLILPAPDITLDEARELFSGEGIIPA
ncbi:MAG: hypothetical protein HY666_03365 [Chloroflexi bacterium]|nr:hypothetical protein [Chloroflexota bacterium]